MLDTGFPRADVENEFLRARRRQLLATLAYRLRGRRGDGSRLMVLDDVVGPLGWRGQRQLGLQTIQLDTIVGTASSRRDFDRRFRPTSARVRDRWERLALAQRRGEAIPPIEVYRVGCAHFVADGHHRVSIAAATRQRLIDAYVTQVRTAAPPSPLDVPCRAVPALTAAQTTPPHKPGLLRSGGELAGQVLDAVDETGQQPVRLAGGDVGDAGEQLAQHDGELAPGEVSTEAEVPPVGTEAHLVAR
jgi:hypothetical protein